MSSNTISTTGTSQAGVPHRSNLCASSWQRLPSSNTVQGELFHYLLDFLPLRDQGRCATVCKDWNDGVKNRDRLIGQVSHPTMGAALKNLPIETFEHVLSSLDPKDKRSAARVNHYWNARIDHINNNQLKILPLKMFEHVLSFLGHADRQSAAGVNLYWGKATIPYVIREMIARASAIPDEDARGQALVDITRALARRGYIDKAIEVANSISDETMKSSAALGLISIVLAKRGDTVKAIELANSIPNELIRGFALRDISKVLAKRGDTVKAIELANSIPNESIRGFALRDISKVSAKRGDTDKA